MNLSKKGGKMRSSTTTNKFNAPLYCSIFRILSFYLRTLLVTSFLGALTQASALPTFARQTGQSCVACHAGGQFPELTPYGRIFKLTGYTIGTQGNPFSAMLLTDVTQNKNNLDSTSGQQIASQNNIPIVDAGSVFIAGKITDNVGAFAQFTYTVYDHQDNSNNWRGHRGSDNTDIRFINRYLTSESDLITGITVHNNPGVQDVWNSTSAWSYPYVGSPGSGAASGFSGLPYATKLEDGTLAQQVGGVGAYAYLNKSIYAELTGYQTATGFWKFLSQGSRLGDPFNPLTYSQGVSPYLRLAYTHDWNEQNAMIGLVALNTNLYQMDSTGLPVFGPVTHYQDKGIDAQYQYLLEPHTITAHFRFVKESINDDTLSAYANSSHLNSLFAKLTYVYRNQYGANISYRRVTGSTDTTAYASYQGPGTGNPLSSTTSYANSPNTKLWTPELFWLPIQNIRVGLQYNLFTEYLGSATNYDGNNRNASDNNSAYLYAWIAF